MRPTKINQHAHPHSLISVFAVHMKKLCILGCPKCAQGRFLSGCAKRQADINLRKAHMSKGTFSDVTAQIIRTTAMVFAVHYGFQLDV